MSEPAIVVVGSLNADLTVCVPRFPAPGETISGDGEDGFVGREEVERLRCVLLFYGNGAV